uniref:amidohydrolase n=1 Tax=Sphingomonas bacterium TaxID=1895847 RepID=UPI00261D8AA5|nr:amidohydrolase [Sphingomonas bacterium]
MPNMIRGLLALLAFVAAPAVTRAQEPPADLILHNGKIWTVDDTRPVAEAVAVRGDRIVRVGSEGEVMALRGKATRLIDLHGELALPGFIDAHTHFENATDWFYEVALNDVDSEPALLSRLAEAIRRVPKGMWITGGDWGTLPARKARAAKTPYREYEPSVAAVDRISADHPLLLRRHDGAYFINSKGLELLHLGDRTPDPADGAYGRDPGTGRLTGMLLGSAGSRVALMLPPKSRARTLIAARALLAELNGYGITGIHDIARVDAISQARIFHADVERSYSDVSIFTDLRATGDLTIRVYPILALDSWSDLASHGITPGSGDDMIRYGALKSFVDGSYMFKPFSNNPRDNPDYAGDLTFRVLDEKDMAASMAGADRLGFDLATHVMGDKAHWLLLNWYEAAIKANPARDRRFRLIHGWYPALGEIERAGRIRAIADVTPSQFYDDLPSLEAKLGPERLRTAYAWRTMIDHGLRLDLVSDWPGSFDKAHPSPINPLELIQGAVLRDEIARRTIKTPLPPQALTIQEAIRAYTINPAFASREEAIKGSITPGKLADIVILSRDILTIPPADLTSARVLFTILGGKIVYEAARP